MELRRVRDELGTAVFSIRVSDEELREMIVAVALAMEHPGDLELPPAYHGSEGEEAFTPDRQDLNQILGHLLVTLHRDEAVERSPPGFLARLRRPYVWGLARLAKASAVYTDLSGDNFAVRAPDGRIHYFRRVVDHLDIAPAPPTEGASLAESGDLIGWRQLTAEEHRAWRTRVARSC